MKSKKADTYEIMAKFEELAQSLNHLPIAKKEDELRENLNSKSAFLQQLQNMTTEFFEMSKKTIDNLNEEEHAALENLSKDKSIIITKADKGNAVVIQNVTDYRDKIQAILNQFNKFERLDKDQTVTRENRLNDLITSLKLGKEIKSRILPCGSRAGVLYGLPKIHKEGTPLRPIISAVLTYNYKLAKYLVEILSEPLLKDSKFVLKDTFDFVNKVSKFNTYTDKYMISFDVESLFTNVPTTETIEIILNRIYKDVLKIFEGFERATLKKLLILCTKESHFQFNGKFYYQIDVVSMGSPLGPLFANVFIADFEEKHMEEMRGMGLNIW